MYLVFSIHAEPTSGSTSFVVWSIMRVDSEWVSEGQLVLRELGPFDNLMARWDLPDFVYAQGSAQLAILVLVKAIRKKGCNLFTYVFLYTYQSI